jgi:hypothetical protein
METFKSSNNPDIREQAKKIVRLSDARKFELAAAEMVTLLKMIAQLKPNKPQVSS